MRKAKLSKLRPSGYAPLPTIAAIERELNQPRRGRAKAKR